MSELLDLGLSPRVARVLANGGITDLEALLARNEREILALPGVGLASMTELDSFLRERDLQLAEDPFGKYLCARHGKATSDTALSTVLLCDDCAAMWEADAFDGKDPEYLGPPLTGYCLNCNLQRPVVRFRQWFLCGVCDRVARSIGRSRVAEDFLMDQWEAHIRGKAPHLELSKTDEPRLRRHPEPVKRAEIDFLATNTVSGKPVLGLELKTGKSYISGPAGIGAKMTQFQLDTSDCDDIVAVMERESIPVYVIHTQVIDRAHPPTTRYVALGAWWTDVFAMEANFRRVQMRPRETRTAAYYDTGMFEDLSTFAGHLESGASGRLAARIRDEGVPRLYS